MRSAELDFVRRLAADIRTNAFPGVELWRKIHVLLDSGRTLDQLQDVIVAELGDEAKFLALDAREPG